MSGSSATAATAHRPPRWLAALVALSAALCLLPAGFAVHYTLGWSRVRAGKDVAAQRATLTGVTWFKGSFVDFVDRLTRTVPPDAGVLLVPSRVETRKGRARWHLYLNHYAYPVRFYTAQPAWASGTLVDYPRWLEHHTSHRGLDAQLTEERAVFERGIEWRLELPVTLRFRGDQVVLQRLVDGGWRNVPLAPSRASGRPIEDEGDPSGLEMDTGEAFGLEEGL